MIQQVTGKLAGHYRHKTAGVFSLITRFLGRKNFSHRRNNFPSHRRSRRLTVEQRVGESQADKLVGVGVGDPHGLSSQVAAGLGQKRSRRQRNTGNFQQNLRGERQRAPHCNQGPGCGDVQRSGELQQFLPALIAATDKNRNRQRQAGPLAAFILRLISIQNESSKGGIHLFLPHLGGQMTC